MNISYITTFDANEIKSFSGIGYYISKALKNQGYNLDIIGNLDDNNRNNKLIHLKSIYYNKIIRKKFLINRDQAVVKSYAKSILRCLKPNTDLIFSVGTIPIALLNPSKPTVFYADACFAGMINFYESYSNLCNETIKSGNLLEQKALDIVSLAIYSSDWAAETAIKSYNINPQKVKVVPFGANLEEEKKYNEIKSIIASRSTTECHLLFLGKDWKRKGGDMALKIALKLNEIGLKTTLHIAGVKEVALKNIPPCVISYGFINKATPEGKKLIENLLSKSHFLILPTRADCTPVVYSEASSFGLPCISTNVGGIPTIIKDNVNGKLFSLEDNEDAYVNYIQKTFCNISLYKQLCYNSFNEYEQRLNWKVAGTSIKSLINNL